MDRETTTSKTALNLPAGEAIDLAGLAAYAQDSIISRTVVENKAGTVTFFAFGKGQGLSEHSAPYHAFAQVLDGRAEFTVGGKPVVADAGHLVILPANIPHALRAVENFKMLLTMFRA